MTSFDEFVFWFFMTAAAIAFAVISKFVPMPNWLGFWALVAIILSFYVGEHRRRKNVAKAKRSADDD